MKNLRTVLCTSLLFAAMACPSGSEQQETSYRSRLGEVDALLAKAGAADKIELTKTKAEIEKGYLALPKESAARGDGLGKLNQALHAAVAAYTPKVAAAEKASSDGLFQSSIAALVGHWRGGAVDVVIDTEGGIAYKKELANSSKSLNGKISKIDQGSFEAGVFGITTTFQLNQRPHQDGGVWKMVLDGTELTRQ